MILLALYVVNIPNVNTKSAMIRWHSGTGIYKMLEDRMYYVIYVFHLGLFWRINFQLTRARLFVLARNSPGKDGTLENTSNLH